MRLLTYEEFEAESSEMKGLSDEEQGRLSEKAASKVAPEWRQYFNTTHAEDANNESVHSSYYLDTLRSGVEKLTDHELIVLLDAAVQIRERYMHPFLALVDPSFNERLRPPTATPATSTSDEDVPDTSDE